MVEKIIETYIDSITLSNKKSIKHLSPIITKCFDYGLLCLLSILKIRRRRRLEYIINLIDKVKMKKKK